jgi:hypothetical protein
MDDSTSTIIRAHERTLLGAQKTSSNEEYLESTFINFGQWASARFKINWSLEDFE